MFYFTDQHEDNTRRHEKQRKSYHISRKRAASRLSKRDQSKKTPFFVFKRLNYILILSPFLGYLSFSHYSMGRRRRSSDR